MKILNRFKDLLKRGNLPDDNRFVPNWLKIKNEQFDDVDISNNDIKGMVTLTNQEFNEFASLTPTSLILTYLSTLSSKNLHSFYSYLDDVVKLEDNTSAREQFEGAMEIFDIDEISNIQKQRATLELPLYINYSKNIYHQATNFKKNIQAKYYPYNKEDPALQFEGYFFKTIYSEPMKFIADYFEQVLSHFIGFYDKSNYEHNKIATHLAKRFGLLINSLHMIQKAQGEEVESIEWFLGTFLEDIKAVNGHDIITDDELIFYLMNTFSSIVLEDDEAYISSMIDVVNELKKYYPFNSESFLYALDELMKSVALKDVSIDNANRFLKIFEELPKLYDILSYEKIMELKEQINYNISNYKPQDNKVFEIDGVKPKLILLNYLVDMEDLLNEQ